MPEPRTFYIVEVVQFWDVPPAIDIPPDAGIGFSPVFTSCQEAQRQYPGKRLRMVVEVVEEPIHA